MLLKDKTRLAAAGVVLVALLVVPAPLLPPHRLAEVIQSALGLGWKAAYLVTAIGLQIAFYGSLGLLAAMAAGQAPTLRRRLRQIAVLPLVVVGMAVLIRSAKLGHWPMLANAIVPIAACVFGVAVGLGLLYRGWKVTLPMATLVIAAVLWIYLSGVSAELNRETAMRLARLTAAGPQLPAGEERFGALVQVAFSLQSPYTTKMVEQNRAALLALGIALGHDRLAWFAGFKPKDELVRAASLLRNGATLGGREDWSRHYTLSAALAVLENPLISEAGGLLKEQLDALTHGSGFSFGDLAADRAGVRFATAATHSEAAAKVMQARLQGGFVMNDFFPPAADLPENLTVDQFRALYHGVGSQLYRQKVGEIDGRIERCAALSLAPSQRP